MDPDAAAPRPLDIESTGSIISGLMRKLSPASTDRAKIADEASKPAAPVGIEGQESKHEKDPAAAVDADSITVSAAPAEAAPTPRDKSAPADAPPTKEKGNTSLSAKEKSTVPTLAIKWTREGKPRKGEDALSGKELAEALLRAHARPNLDAHARPNLDAPAKLDDGSTWRAAVHAEPAVILTKSQSRQIKSAGMAIGLVGVVLGGILVLLLQALVGGSKGSDQTIAPLSASPPAPPVAAFDNYTCFEAQDTPTASSLTRAVFVPTFFNLSCIADGSTSDTCDAQIAADYTHRRFSALRFVRISLSASRTRRGGDAICMQPRARAT